MTRAAPGILHLGESIRRNIVASCDHRIRTRERMTWDPARVTCQRCRRWIDTERARRAGGNG